MRKIIMAINVTPDGFCDHRYGIADAELHKFFADLLRDSGTELFGRKTFQLMEAYWPDVARNNTGTEDEIEFAKVIDASHKIVFSKAGFTTAWKNTTVLNRIDRDEILKLKQSPGKNIGVGSPSIIDQLAQMNLIDEYIFVVHPVISGNGKRFFELHKLDKQINLSLYDKKFLESGAVALYYRRAE